MSVFDELRPYFFHGMSAALEEIQAANLERLPEFVVVQTEQLNRGLGFSFSYDWNAKTSPFGVYARAVIALSDNEICLLVSELLSGGNAAAAELKRRMNVAERAHSIRSLVGRGCPTRLALFTTGANSIIR